MLENGGGVYVLQVSVAVAENGGRYILQVLETLPKNGREVGFTVVESHFGDIMKTGLPVFEICLEKS